MTSPVDHGPQRRSPGPRTRRLSDVVAHDAPLPPKRSLALVAAIARTVARADPASSPVRLEPSDVVLHDDGTVELDPPADAPVCPDPADSELGASLGRMLFALLVGRAPLSRDEGFEPAITAALPMSTCALVARSASEAPGQWPRPEEWVAELDRVAAAQAPPPPPAERRRTQRRTLLLVLGVAVLLAASVVAVLLAPSWWDGATDDEHGLRSTAAPAAVQSERSAQSERPVQSERFVQSARASS